MTDDAQAEIRRLRADLQRAREEVEHLTQHLAYADQQIAELRAKAAGDGADTP